MDALTAIFATGLALSQVTLAPEEVRTKFDPQRDQAAVAQLLTAGCGHMRKAFDVEDLNLDDFIEVAMEDLKGLAGAERSFRGIDFNDLRTAYRQFCKMEALPGSVIDLGAVIDFYNKAVTDLPDHNKLKGIRLPGAGVVLDRDGERFAEVFEANARRVWTPLAEIPEHVQKAFIAAEDKRFFEHRGIDERGLIRAFVGNLASAGRPQGGSTITQQIVKNLLVGDDLTYERKIREIILADRVEHALSKQEILELYLNSVYLGRGAWGIELAARSYFGKPAKQLTLQEGALLAGLTKGPSYYSPDRYPDRAQERLSYVISRLKEEGAAGAETLDQNLRSLPLLVANERPRRDFGFHFVDQVARETKSIAGMGTITSNSYTVRSTIDPRLQRAVEGTLQEGLSRYERSARRVEFQGAEANLAQLVETIEKITTSKDRRPAWQRAISAARLPLYDVHWTPAVVIEIPKGRRADVFNIGLADGRTMPMSVEDAAARRMLKLYDVVLVKVNAGTGKAARAEMRVRPIVQGAVIVLENKTGRILAMTGGFSYPLSQLNRTTQAVRQPGSAIKPLSYLAALGNGLQPNTLIKDETITLPPPGGGKGQQGGGKVRGEEYWTPKNYDGNAGGLVTMRGALERSRNLATVRLLDGGIESKPEASLDRVCELAIEARIYRECARYYPFVLGAQPVRPVDLAAFYAAIANEGRRPTPHVVESIEQDGQTIFQHENILETIGSVDRAAFYQLKSMLQGVLARGTARSISGISAYAAGKTGTSDDENDAWFVGFTNDVTIAIWLGYDNADGKRRTLGHGGTGGNLAAPIFASVAEAAWTHVAAKTVLAPPSDEAKIALSCTSVSSQPDVSRSRHRADSGRAGSECLRVNAQGKVVDAEYRLVSREAAVPKRPNRDETRSREAQEREFWGGRDYWGGRESPGGRDFREGGFWGWGWGSPPQRDWRRAEPGQFFGNWR